MVVMFSVAAHGQMILDTLQLMEFEVMGSRTATKTTSKQHTADSLLKKDLSHLSLADLLAQSAPVFIKSYGRGGPATVSMRGSSASHTEVLWNGFSLNSPMMGQADLSQIPNQFFEKAVINFGGGSLRHTSGALGGSVNLESNTANAKPALFQLEQMAGSFQTTHTNASLSLSTPKLTALTSLSFQRSENDFEYFNQAILPSREMKQENASYRHSGFTQLFAYSPNAKNRLILTTWNQWNHRNIPLIMTNVGKGSYQQEYQSDFSSRTMLGWTYHHGSHKLHISSAYFVEKQHYFLRYSRNGDQHIAPIFDTENISKSWFMKSSYDKTFANGFKLSTGIDLTLNTIQSVYYEDERQRSNVSLFASLRKEITQRLILEAMLRQEIVDQSAMPLIPYVGLNYQLLKSRMLFFRMNGVYNYSLPSLNDLYWIPSGNASLKPEKALQFEAGFDYRETILSKVTIAADLTGYFSHIEDWIQWAPGTFGFFSPENIQEVYARGIELKLTATTSLGRVKTTFSAQYGYTRTTDESMQANLDGVSGRQLIYIPVHQGNAFLYLDYHNYYLRWNMTAAGQRTTSYNDIHEVNNTLPAYMLNDLSIGRLVKLSRTRLELRLRVNNMFDVDYQVLALRAMPGRYYEVFLTFSID